MDRKSRGARNGEAFDAIRSISDKRRTARRDSPGPLIGMYAGTGDISALSGTLGKPRPKRGRAGTRAHVAEAMNESVYVSVGSSRACWLADA